jgi:hypothetical protein
MKALQIAILTITAVSAASASVTYNVQLDTTGLTPAATYYLDFQFIGSNENTVNLTGFSFGGGTGPAGPFELDTITNFFNEVMVPFQPGSNAAFQVTSTNISPPVGGFPDELSFFLLDSGFNPLTSSDLADAFFYLDLTGGQPNIQTFSGPGVPAPVFTSTVAAPEPATFWLVAFALSALVFRRVRYRRA